jgi:hypothetical protein
MLTQQRTFDETLTQSLAASESEIQRSRSDFRAPRDIVFLIYYLPNEMDIFKSNEPAQPPS